MLPGWPVPRNVPGSGVIPWGLELGTRAQRLARSGYTKTACYYPSENHQRPARVAGHRAPPPYDAVR